ncbi:MAG: nucleoside recognition domain-containing protein, partial [Deltaproteobacteria bacterium]|nr:nucleoside recognition domain-containing protein [Deltaproteobacteria bacterium]
MKKRASNLRGFIVPLLLVGLALAGLGAGVRGVAGTSLSTEQIFHKIGVPLARLIFFLGLGLFVGQVLESTGWTQRLGLLVRPMTRWAHLREESGAAFIASFVSGIVANTLLMNSHTDNRLSRTELTLTYLLNNGLPLYLVHLPTT